MLDLLENKTRLDELQPEIQLLVLANLDMDRILALPSFGVRYHQFAEDVFKRKYSQKSFEIADPLLMDMNEIREVNDIVYVKQFGEILRVLKKFGHLITKLSIEYNQFPTLGGVNMAPIIKYINKYCADSLIEFSVTVTSDYMEFFDKMAKPFQNVEILSISGRFNKLASANHDFAELFPSVTSLSLNYVQVFQQNSLDLNFQHLKQLNISFGQIDNSSFSQHHAEQLIRRNPPIHSMKLVRSDSNLLNVANEALPELESLELVGLVIKENKRIVFENVKLFTVVGDLGIIPETIAFKSLTEFHWIGLPVCNDKWMDLVEQNPHLMRLSVKTSVINDPQLKKLSEMQLNLVDISLLLHSDVQDDTIVEFVRKNKHMKRIQFAHKYSLKSTADAIQNEFGNEWTIEIHHNNNENQLTLERY